MLIQTCPSNRNHVNWKSLQVSNPVSTISGHPYGIGTDSPFGDDTFIYEIGIG
jgi:hypothetical protein